MKNTQKSGAFLFIILFSLINMTVLAQDTSSSIHPMQLFTDTALQKNSIQQPNQPSSPAYQQTMPNTLQTPGIPSTQPSTPSTQLTIPPNSTPQNNIPPPQSGQTITTPNGQTTIPTNGQPNPPHK